VLCPTNNHPDCRVHNDSPWKIDCLSCLVCGLSIEAAKSTRLVRNLSDISASEPPKDTDHNHTTTMPPRLNFRAASRSLAILSRPAAASSQPRIAQIVARRTFAEEKQPAQGPNQNQLPHVSEEAAEYAEITGGTKPDMSQGTPVQDVCFTMD
jgi:hypothetical protein